MIATIALVLALVAVLCAAVALVLVIPIYSRVWKLHSWAAKHSQWCEGQLVPSLRQTFVDFNRELQKACSNWPVPGPGGGADVPPKDVDYP